MPIYMPEEKPRELAPAGAHTAVCFRVVDLGTQQTPYGAKQQLYIAWELPDEYMSDGRPFAIGRYYTYSSDPKAKLRGDIEGWLGRQLSARDFGKLDLGEMLGKTCTLGITHETKGDRERAVIVSVMRPGKEVPARLSASIAGIALSLAERPFNQVDYEELPGWLREAIAKSPEYRAASDWQPAAEPARQRLKAALVKPPEPAAGEAGTRAALAVALDDDVPF